MKNIVLLCVDDERVVLNGLHAQLISEFGSQYTIELAESGEEAIDLFKELLDAGTDIPIVISDQVMPGIKGHELLQRIHRISPSTYTVLLTGHSDIEAVSEAVNHANLYRYLTKPWDGKDLVMTVREAIKGYYRDIQLNEQNQLLEQHNKELEILVVERTQELEATNAELSLLNSSKDKFFSIIAHDLKSPFSGFLGLTKIMSDEFDDLTSNELKEFIKNLHDSAGNLYKLLENLLEWSLVKRGAIQFNPDNCNLNMIVKQILAVQSEISKQKEIVLSSTIPDGLLVTADIPMLNAIIRNLISNSIKFTPRGGKIEVGIVRTDADNSQEQASSEYDHCVTVYVKDNGIGMSKSIKDKLFKIEEKTSRPGTENEPSTGLGLLLCKEFVEKHGGRIWVESEEGIGSTFFFTLNHSNK